MNDKPFFAETQQLFDNVRDHAFEPLAALCDDDFGIVDINAEGGTLVIRNRAEWESWFRNLFGQLDAMDARTWSEITGYQAVKTAEMGYSVVDFDQMLVHNGKRLRFSCLSTIVWKKVGNAWKEARYHSSLLGVREEEAAA
ncbi:nuclear transport factor 2 family protein [Hymenobacter latericus]|uniref:nuclear transport factor 2 family protein n=1 Tax=Hymenobacter sp. YIM 151858-1 TaxID=2987688 RepID=UPI00222669BC|nr:nuclear transport factor 2 family protein [Hymenobacter sp. YIM 151858-1]UYZ58261.1 nuclear transport factor 2 family protein [Hymenobacter sp. YIM 151858-1]